MEPMRKTEGGKNEVTLASATVHVIMDKINSILPDIIIRQVLASSILIKPIKQNFIFQYELKYSTMKNL